MGDEAKRLFVTMGGIQTVLVALMATMVVVQSATWVLLGCILLFSLVNLAYSVVIGNVVARTTDAVRRLSGQFERLDRRTRHPRPDGLVEVGFAPPRMVDRGEDQ